MKTYTLGYHDLNFIIADIPESDLRKLLLEAKRDLLESAPQGIVPGSITLSLNREYLDALVDFLSGIFMRTGLQADYEPNQLGMYVESLIDIFNPYRDEIEFDTYIPAPLLTCPICGKDLGDRQGYDGPCGLMVWRQGEASPIDQPIDDDGRLDQESLARVRLPESFRIFTNCCSQRFAVEALCRTKDSVWCSAHVVTAATAKQHKLERRADFRARLKWLRGGAA